MRCYVSGNERIGCSKVEQTRTDAFSHDYRSYGGMDHGHGVFEVLGVGFSVASGIDEEVIYVERVARGGDISDYAFKHMDRPSYPFTRSHNISWEFQYLYIHHLSKSS